MQLGLYLAIFAYAGMEPEMQLDLYLVVFANAGMEPEMEIGLYFGVFANCRNRAGHATRAVFGCICK